MKQSIKYRIWKRLTFIRDSWNCPQFLRDVIDWLRDGVFWPDDL